MPGALLWAHTQPSCSLHPQSLYLAGGRAPGVRALPEEHELADVARTLCFLAGRTEPGQVPRQVHQDGAQALRGASRIMMTKDPELYLPSTQGQLLPGAQRQHTLTQSMGSDTCKAEERVILNAG